MYSLPYILLFLTLMGLALLNKHVKAAQRSWVVFAAYFIMFLFFGFRGFICGDWREYYPFFDGCSISDLSLSFYAGNDTTLLFEPGFCLLALLCKFIWNDFVFFQAICSLINLILLHFFLRRTVKEEVLGVALFFLFGGFVLMTDLMRNSIAILLVANALVNINKRKPVEFFSICLVAGMFHFSALLCIPLYWILRIKTGKWWFLAIAVMVNLIYVFHVEWFTSILSSVAGEAASLLTDKATAYARNYEQTSVISIGFLERLFTTIVLFLFYDKMVEKNKNMTIYLNMFLLYLALLMGLWENAVLAERVSYLMIPSYWVILPSLVKVFKRETNKPFFYAIIIAYGIVKMASLTNHPTNVYDNHLFGAKTFEERIAIYQAE